MKRHLRSVIAVACLLSCVFVVLHVFFANKTILRNNSNSWNDGRQDKHETSDLLTNDASSLKNYEHTLNIDYNIERVFSFGRVRNSTKDRIPKIIHLTWKDETIPGKFVENVKSFYEKNPDWKFYFWTDASARHYINIHRPDLSWVFDGYRSNVSKSDALRYIVMYFFGGAYFDLDTVCLKPLDTVVETEQCIMGPEPVEHTAIAHGMTSLLASSAFMCKPRHGFFKQLVDNLPFTFNHWDILEAAGPKFVSKQFNAYIKHMQGGIDSDKYETFHIASLELFEGDSLNYKSYIRRMCTRRYHAESIEFKACKVLKGRTREANSPGALTKHDHFNTYNKMHELKFIRDNQIKNIIPTAKIYPEF